MKKNHYLKLAALLGAALVLSACDSLPGTTEPSVDSTAPVSESTPSSSSVDDEDSDSDSSVDDGEDGEKPDQSGDGEDGDGEDEEPEVYQTPEELHQALVETASKPLAGGTVQYSSKYKDFDPSISKVTFQVNDHEVLTTSSEDDDPETQSYVGIVGDVYYDLNNLGGSYPYANRYKIVADDSQVTADDVRAESDVETLLEYEQSSYSGDALLKGGYFGGIDIIGWNDAFPVAPETPAETLDETDEGEGDGETPAEEPETVNVITGFSTSYAALTKTRTYTVDSVDDTGYFQYELSLSAQVKDDGTLSRVEITEKEYTEDTWDFDNHAPKEGAAVNTLSTYTFSDLDFVDALPASDPSNPLVSSDTLNNFVTSAEFTMPSGYDMSGGWMPSMIPENTVYAGSEVRDFYIADEVDEETWEYTYKCTPADAYDKESKFRMTSPVSGYESYFTENEWGGFTAVLPEGSEDPVQVKVNVGNSFNEKIGVAEITIEKKDESASQGSDFTIAGFDNYGFDSLQVNFEDHSGTGSLKVGQTGTLIIYDPGESWLVTTDNLNTEVTSGSEYAELSGIQSYGGASAMLSVIGKAEGTFVFTLTDGTQTFTFTISVTAATAVEGE